MRVQAIYNQAIGIHEMNLSLLSEDEKVYVLQHPHKSMSRYLGRLAAKKAIKEYYQEKFLLDFSDIEIKNKDSGAPFFWLLHEPSCVTTSCLLSISHTDTCGIAVVTDNGERGIGIDIESLDRFTYEFGLTFLAPSEIAWVMLDRNEAESLKRIAFLWCVKEAYLKAVGVGLQQDPRSIILLEPRLCQGNMIIMDKNIRVNCFLFWNMVYNNNVIVGLSIIK